MAESKHSKQQIARIVEEFTGSGQTRAQFSKQHGIHPTTLDSWRRKSPARLVKVHLARPQREPHQGTFTLTVANGRRIECSWDFAPDELTALIRLAEQA